MESFLCRSHQDELRHKIAAGRNLYDLASCCLFFKGCQLVIWQTVLWYANLGTRHQNWRSIPKYSMYISGTIATIFGLPGTNKYHFTISILPAFRNFAHNHIAYVIRTDTALTFLTHLSFQMWQRSVSKMKFMTIRSCSRFSKKLLWLGFSINFNL